MLLNPALASIPIPFSLREINNCVSTLGRIVATISVQQRLTLHELSEFPAYTSAPINSTDEPLFFRLERCNHGLTAETCACCKDKNITGKRRTLNLVMGPWMTFALDLSKPRTSQTRHFQTMVTVWVGLKGCTGFAHNDGLGKTHITRAVDGAEDFSGYVWQNRVKAALGHPIDTSCVGPKVVDYLALELAFTEYKARHKNNEAANVSHLPNWCGVCRMHVTTLHDCDKCKSQMLAGENFRAEMLAKQRESSRKRYRAALAAQGLGLVYSPEEFDRSILSSRGSVMNEAVARFDKDLSRKGNKYRIQ